MNQVTTELTPHVAVINGAIKTTSIVVAEHFGKLHKDVLRAVKNLDCSPEYHQRNFALMQIEVEIGNGAKRMSPAYEMTKDGFTFLAMGFTGKEAGKWKEAYINAFNAMADRLGKIEQLPEPPKTKKAIEGGLTLETQDEIKALMQAQAAQLPKDKQARFMISTWSALGTHFGIKKEKGDKTPAYKYIPEENRLECLSLIARLSMDNLVTMTKSEFEAIKALPRPTQEGELLPKQEPVTNTSLTITLAPLQPGEIMKRWLITHHGNDMVQMWAVKPDTEVKQRDHFIRDLKTDGYLVIKKNEFRIGNFVMEQVPANLLPVLIEKAGIRLKAINLNH